MRIVFRYDLFSAEPRNTLNAVRTMVLASGLPAAPAKVGSHRPRLAYGPAPAQGQWAEREYLDIYLQESCCIAQVQERLQSVAPQGLTILEVKRIPVALPCVQNLATAAKYRIQGDFTSLNVSGRKWEAFVRSGRLWVNLRAANGMKFSLDAAPYLLDYAWHAPDDFTCTLQRVQDKWLRPEWLLCAWLGIEALAGGEPFGLPGISVTRQYLLWRDSQGEWHPL